MRFAVLILIGAWWLWPQKAAIEVFEGSYLGFRAIVCGRTVCTAPSKYCMRFAGGFLWCFDEWRMYELCTGDRSGPECAMLGSRDI